MAGMNWEELYYKIKDGKLNKYYSIFKTEDVHIVTNKGKKIYIYKNRIYIQNHDCKYVEFSVWSGAIEVDDCKIIATRGPHEGIYSLVYRDGGLEMFAGIGVYRYDRETGKHLGITDHSLEYMYCFIESIDFDYKEKAYQIIKQLRIDMSFDSLSSEKLKYVRDLILDSVEF